MGLFDRILGRTENISEKSEINIVSGWANARRADSSENPLLVAAAAGLSDIMSQSNRLRANTNFTTDFDIYDSMLELDPELNGAVRAVSLTANNYEINYKTAKNAKLREGIRMLVEETIDFDDILINGMRNLMVYGNDMSKLVGRTGVGITQVQSLPISQMTITDGRPSTEQTDRMNPIVEATTYIIREGDSTEEQFNADEILHIRIDYRSNWFLDSENRETYGIWGASRFSSLKQAIRAKYNTLNNRMALEESMTKQFITINSSAIEHISDPDEQRARLTFIMDEVVKTLESLRGDQVPIFPDYIEIHHTDTRNTIPDNTSFLDTVNADIAAVLQVPRVAAGQERGSTFAATYNANVWATTAIKRLQGILAQSIQDMFSKHLELMGIEHQMKDIPKLEFSPVEDESPSVRMQRSVLGYNSGILTLNQSLDIIGEPSIGRIGDVRKDEEGGAPTGRLPRRDSQPGVEDTTPDIEEEEVEEPAQDDLETTE